MDRRTFISWLAALAVLPSQLRGATGCTVSNAPDAQRFDVVKGAEWLLKVAVVGDWGTGGALQKRVASAMLKKHGEIGGFGGVISTGDNIYPSGVNSSGDPQWKSKFEKIYAPALLKLPWVAVLGNHDYRGKPDAQIEYGEINENWIMPARYYVHTIDNTPQNSTSIFGIDTQQLLTRADGFEKQLEWFRGAMKKDKSKWKLVVGHHPMRSYGHYGDQDWMLKQIKPVMEKYGSQVYFCGHDHDLQIIKNPSDKFHCVVSGSGGGCRSTAFGKNTLAAGTNGGFVSWRSNAASAVAELVDDAGKTYAAVRIDI